MRRLLCLAILWFGAAWACPEDAVDLELSYPVPPYTEVAEFLRAKLRARGIPLAEPPSPCPRFFIALGQKAGEAIRRRDPNTPIVAALVLDEAAIQKLAPATGVWLMHPLEVQWQALRAWLPQLTQLTVLYDPRFAAQLDSLERLARRDRIRLHAVAVDSPKQLATVAERLPSVGAVFILGDGRVFNLTAAQALLLFARARRGCGRAVGAVGGGGGHVRPRLGV
ncbi:hypothetical protein JCM13664_14170 [Methylothermus subterraneus]